jgi:predicted NBD/HSP70 family sugar kinase
VPRVVHPRHGTLAPPLLPPWHRSENPAKALTRALRTVAGPEGPDHSFQVRLDNDASLGALAIANYHRPQTDILVYVKASTGVGAGITLGNQLFRGARGGAGELGHVVVDPGGRYCPCGGRGCLETLIGADALVANAQTALAGEDFDPPQTMDELISQARQGNAICRRVLHDAGEQLGLILGQLCTMLNPNTVVVGGTLGRAAELVREPCLVAIQRHALDLACDPQQFDLDVDEHRFAVAHGALIMSIEGHPVQR